MKSLSCSERTYSVLCAILFSSVFGCGYYSYKAYYVPEDVLKGGRKVITSRVGHLLPSGIGDYQAWFVCWPVWERDVRECFDVSVEFARCETGTHEDVSTRPSGKTQEPEPSVAVLMVSSQATHKVDTLAVLDSPYVSGRKVYNFGRICLPRRYHEIVVRFTATLEAKTGETISSQQYDVKLFRWENRNWLGLE
jgi:hypothetical protein